MRITKTHCGRQIIYAGNDTIDGSSSECGCDRRIGILIWASVDYFFPFESQEEVDAAMLLLEEFSAVLGRAPTRDEMTVIADIASGEMAITVARAEKTARAMMAELLSADAKTPEAPLRHLEKQILTFIKGGQA